MAQCTANTRSGNRCRVPVERDSELCHIHDPDGLFQANVAKASAHLEPEEVPAIADAGPPPADARRVHTSGSCRPNPGVGGWAWVLQGQEGTSGAGSVEMTTSPRMELTAAHMALLAVPGPIVIVSDSRYVVNCMRDQWWVKWIRNDWKLKWGESGQDIKNRDLWEPFIELVRVRAGEVWFEWVAGHSGHEWNKRAERLAREQIPDRDVLRRRTVLVG